MATLAQRIDEDLKTALKARDQRRLDTLRLVKASIQRSASDKRKDTLDDPEVVQVLVQQAKQRRETIDAAKKGGRQDVLSAAEAELEMINTYLPQQLAPEAIKQLIEEAIKTAGPNQGAIMKFIMAKAVGAADGKLVSQLVGERLKQGA